MTYAREWRCAGCGRYLGRWIAGVLHEPNRHQSGAPVQRKCPKCGTINALDEPPQQAAEAEE